jgi:outer membrane lipoprotein-sorting protein
MRLKQWLGVFMLIALISVGARDAAAQSGSSPAAPATAFSANPAPLAGADAPLPSAAEILQKFEKAIGGREAWSGFTTRTIKGIYQPEDLSGFAGIEIISKAPDKRYMKTTFPNGIAVREVCDGKSAWIEDARGGMHQFTGAALDSRLRSAHFNNTGEGLLLALTGRVLGTAQVGIHSTYVVEFQPDKKITSKVYFDVQSGLPVRVDDTIHQEEGDYTVQTFTDDYREVDGAYFPFRIKHVEKGNVFTVRVTEVKNNPPVDDSVFLKSEGGAGDQ